MSGMLKTLFNTSFRHTKLSEDWATLQQPVEEGVTFLCRSLGSSLVDNPKGVSSISEAVKRVVHTAKSTSRKPERVSLFISPKGITIKAAITGDLLQDTSINNIAFCSSDANYDHVFAFVASSKEGSCECHAFLCSTSKTAQTIAISIAHAFNIAYESFKGSSDKKLLGEESPCHSNDISKISQSSPLSHELSYEMSHSSIVNSSGYISNSPANSMCSDNQPGIASSSRDQSPLVRPTTTNTPVKSAFNPMRKNWFSFKSNWGNSSTSTDEVPLRLSKAKVPWSSIPTAEDLDDRDCLLSEE